MNGSHSEVRYQVFVSSTFTDLKEEREKVLQAILECKAFPAGMELFPSADDEQFDFIKREIDSSDYYILVIAGRYGSLADDGVSFTEKEFDYALAQKKPILAFLVQDLGKLLSEKCEGEPEMRDKLSAFREKAKKSRLIKYFTNSDELKGQVLQSLNYQFRLSPKRGWVPAGQSKRDDLEEIRMLQNKVITLESENAELKATQGKTAMQLAQGEDVVSWTVDTRTLCLGREQFQLAQVTLITNWDEILCALYPGATSRLHASMVNVCLLRLLADKLITDKDLPSDSIARWRTIAHGTRSGNVMNLDFLQNIKADIYRQYTGLGFIEEITEGVNDISSGVPITVYKPVWRLTRRGEEYLALIRGFKRIE